MEKTKTYYPHLDVLKGIAILLMVMGHVIPWTLDQAFIQKPLAMLSGNELYLSLVYKIIYSFHMPLLFFVSGYLFYKPERYDLRHIKGIVSKRVTRLLIPYFFTGSLLFISRGNWGYWFLQCLFFMDVMISIMLFIIDYFELNLKKELSLYALVGIALYLFGKLDMWIESNTFGIVVIGRAFNFYPAFIVGLLMKKYVRFRDFLSNKNVVFGCLILYIIAFVLKGMEIPVIGLLSSIILPITVIIYLNNLCSRKFAQSVNNSQTRGG